MWLVAGLDAAGGGASGTSVSGHFIPWSENSQLSERSAFVCLTPAFMPFRAHPHSWFMARESIRRLEGTGVVGTGAGQRDEHHREPGGDRARDEDDDEGVLGGQGRAECGCD